MAIPSTLMKRMPCLRVLENRWLRIVMWFICLLFCTCIYTGWTALSADMAEADYLGRASCPDWMYDDEAVIRKAKEESEDKDSFNNWWDDYYEGVPDREFEDYYASIFFCRAQQMEMSTGYTLSTAGEFIGGFIAGVLFDEVGAFATSVVGGGCFVVGWTCVVKLGHGNAAVYKMGMFISGMATNYLSFPAFLLTNMFPSHPAAAISVVLGAQTTNAGIAQVIRTIQEGNFEAKYTNYIYFFCCPLIVLYCFTMPLNRKALAREGLLVESSIVIPNKVRWKSFLDQMMTYEYATFVLWYIICMGSYNWYGTILWDVTYNLPIVDEIVGWLFLTQGIFSITFGFVNDKTKTLPTCFAVNIALLYMWGLLDPEKLGVEWGTILSSVFMVLSNAHVYTTKYTYVEEVYNAESFGKIAGSIGAFGGLFQLLNIAINDAMPDVMMVGQIYNILGLLQLIALFALVYWRYVKKRKYEDGFLPAEYLSNHASDENKPDQSSSSNSSSDYSSAPSVKSLVTSA